MKGDWIIFQKRATRSKQIESELIPEQ